MTTPWQPDAIPQGSTDPQDFFNVRDAQGHLLLVRIQDEVVKFATKDSPDGMKLLMRGPNKGKYVPNNVVRCTIADLNLDNPVDGQKGKIYEEAVIFAGTLVKDFKKAVGKTLLLVWKQADPSDKSSPYSYQLYNENPGAVTVAQEFLARHPEFMTIPAPAPYVLQAREEYHPPQQQQYPQQQGQWGQQPGTQPYPPAQPGYGGPPNQGYGQPQWQQGPPSQRWQPDPWAPQSQPPQGNGSFLSRSTGTPPPEYLQHQPNQVNHHGQPQPQEPPY